MNFKHFVNEETKEVWIQCDSAITAMGLGGWRNKYYPGYTIKIASKKYFEELGGQS